MKKMTKWLIFLALLSIVTGTIGIGISLKQFNKNRLTEEISLEKNYPSVTIKLNNNSPLHVKITQTNNPTLALKEHGLIPNHLSYKLTEHNKQWLLEINNPAHSNKKHAIGFNAPALSTLEILLPKSLEKISLVSDHQKSTSISLYNSSFDEVTTKLTATDLFLNDLKINSFHANSQNGGTFGNHLTVFNDASIKSSTENISIKNSKFTQNAILESTKGNIQVYKTNAKNLSLKTETGLINAEQVQADLEITNKLNDTYLINPDATDNTKLNSDYGNLFVLVPAEKANHYTFNITNNQKLTTYKNAKIVNNHSAKISLNTLQGHTQLMTLVHQQPEDIDDDEPIENNYSIEKDWDSPLLSDLLSLDKLYDSDSPIVDLIN